MVTIRPGPSAPADLVYWTFIQTGRRSDPGFESVLTLLISLTFHLHVLLFTFLKFHSVLIYVFFGCILHLHLAYPLSQNDHAVWS